MMVGPMDPEGVETSAEQEGAEVEDAGRAGFRPEDPGLFETSSDVVASSAMVRAVSRCLFRSALASRWVLTARNHPPGSQLPSHRPFTERVPWLSERRILRGNPLPSGRPGSRRRRRRPGCRWGRRVGRRPTTGGSNGAGRSRSRHPG